MTISKKEWEKRKAATAEREKNYRNDYQKEKYKFVNVQFRLDDEKDTKVLEFLENQQESRATVIKNILYEYITRNQK